MNDSGENNRFKTKFSKYSDISVRTTKTAREEVEEKYGTKRQKQLKEMVRGLVPTLSDLKLKHGGQLAWGQLYRQLSKDGEVMEIS